MTRFKIADAPTGVALITVDADGENEIVVAPGANAELLPDDVDLPDCDGVLCQLEIPLATVEHVSDDGAGRVLPERRAGARPCPCRRRDDREPLRVRGAARIATA